MLNETLHNRFAETTTKEHAQIPCRVYADIYGHGLKYCMSISRVFLSEDDKEYDKRYYY
jgi:hypothetical protein